MNDEEPQIIEKTPSDDENHGPKPETSRNPEISQEIPSQSSPQAPENNTETDTQETEKVIYTRSEKYNLRPNPNPNYSDSYRY